MDDAMIDLFTMNGMGIFCWVLVWATTSEYMILGKRRPECNASRQEQDLLSRVVSLYCMPFSLSEPFRKSSHRLVPWLISAPSALSPPLTTLPE